MFKCLQVWGRRDIDAGSKVKAIKELRDTHTESTRKRRQRRSRTSSESRPRNYNTSSSLPFKRNCLMGEPGPAWPVVGQPDRHAEIAPINEMTKWTNQVGSTYHSHCSAPWLPQGIARPTPTPYSGRILLLLGGRGGFLLLLLLG